MNIVKMQDTIDRLRSGRETIRKHAKAGTLEVVGTAVGMATSAGIGAYDQAKGVSNPTNDNGIVTASIGPVPVALGVAALGKVAALSMLGKDNAEARLASSFGQAGADCWSYVMGRRMWIRHTQATGS